MKQSQLISKTAEILEVEASSVKVVVRKLREAGLFTTGARGVNAPDMTTLDMVRVFMALVVSTSPSRAVEDVEYFRNLKRDLSDPGEDLMALQYKLGIGEDQTLEEFLLEVAEGTAKSKTISTGILSLSEAGEARVMGHGEFWCDFHDREAWNFMEALKSASDGPDREAAMQKVSDTQAVRVKRFANRRPINRSGSVALSCLRSMGAAVNE